jgi:hypothetical protein
MVSCEIANIVHGELVELDDGAKTTLIVVPRSVMDHWYIKITSHFRLVLGKL